MKEPGKTGSLWRLHYTVSLPALTCDFFNLTAPDRPGTRESFRQFPIQARDDSLVYRGYSTAVGIRHVAAAEGHVTVRVDT